MLALKSEDGFMIDYRAEWKKMLLGIQYTELWEIGVCEYSLAVSANHVRID